MKNRPGRESVIHGMSKQEFKGEKAASAADLTYEIKNKF